MKTRSYILLILLLAPIQLYANNPDGEPDKAFLKKVGRLVGTGIKAGINRFAPGMGDKLGGLIGLGSMEDKVDRVEDKVEAIQKNQKSGVDKLRDIALKAMETKNKVEEIYYYKQQAQENGQAMLRGLKQASASKALGGLGEDMLGVSLNPADYLPDTDLTREMRHNLENDFSLERGLIKEGKFLLSGTRAALVESGMMDKMSPKEFDKALKKAEAIENNMKLGLKAMEQEDLKQYKAEIEKLKKDIKILNKSKDMQGVTLEEGAAIEQTIELKKDVIRKLKKEIKKGMKKACEPDVKQSTKLLAKNQEIQSAKETKKWIDHHARVQRDYGHLWRFW